MSGSTRAPGANGQPSAGAPAAATPQGDPAHRGSLSPAASPITRVSAPIRQQVIEAVRTAVVNGNYEPGQRIVEQTLCTQLGVSRSVIRESLRYLEAKGLIRNVPGVGPTVRTLSLDEAKGIYEVRAAMEALAAELFAGRASQAQVDDLRQSVSNLPDPTATTIDEFIQAKSKFYAVLIGGSGNSLIAEVLETLNVRISQLRRMTLKAPERLSQSREELDAIMAAIERRDRREAARLTRQHVENAAATVGIRVGSEQTGEELLTVHVDRENTDEATTV